MFNKFDWIVLVSAGFTLGFSIVLWFSGQKDAGLFVDALNGFPGVYSSYVLNDTKQ